jgi:Domain of unknown function (DUF1932)
MRRGCHDRRGHDRTVGRVSGSEFGLASEQGAGGRGDQRGGRPLCRGGGHGADRAGTDRLADAAGGGPHATAFLPEAHELGFRGASVFSDLIGQASAAKMCRSVIVKGVEALLAESLLAARRYGVEDAVLDSLGALLPVGDWRSLSRYMIGRSLQHGRRRAAEMREVAIAVREAGLDPWMSSACAERQDWAAQRHEAAAQSSLGSMLDAMLASLPD